MFQEGKQSLEKHIFPTSNSGCRGALCIPSSLWPQFLSCSALTTEGIHSSHLVYGRLVRLCMESVALLEAEMLIVKPVECAGRQSKTLGQVRPNSVGYMHLPLNIHQHVPFPQQRS